MRALIGRLVILDEPWYASHTGRVEHAAEPALGAGSEGTLGIVTPVLLQLVSPRFRRVAALYVALLRSLKVAVDPAGTMNPGVVLVGD